jgi:F420H(2)-dependent quinone reductase
MGAAAAGSGSSPEHGRRAQYVRNLEADPNVRVKSGGRWYAGRAHILDDDDPLARARWMADTLGPLHKADSLAARLLSTQPLTIRIDLEPTGTGQPA